LWCFFTRGGAINFDVLRQSAGSVHVPRMTSTGVPPRLTWWAFSMWVGKFFRQQTRIDFIDDYGTKSRCKAL